MVSIVSLLVKKFKLYVIKGSHFSFFPSILLNVDSLFNMPSKVLYNHSHTHKKTLKKLYFSEGTIVRTHRNREMPNYWIFTDI